MVRKRGDCVQARIQGVGAGGGGGRPILRRSFAVNPRPNWGIFITRPTGGGGAISSPPLISETTGPILKIKAAFESPWKHC